VVVIVIVGVFEAPVIDDVLGAGSLAMASQIVCRTAVDWAAVNVSELAEAD
jgi:hypothetical protein